MGASLTDCLSFRSTYSVPGTRPMCLGLVHTLSLHTHRHKKAFTSESPSADCSSCSVLRCSRVPLFLSSLYSNDDCTACEPGKYTEEANQTECLSCQPGAYSAVSICTHKRHSTKILTKSHIQRLIKGSLIHIYVPLRMYVCRVGRPLRRPAPFARRESSMNRATYQAVRLALLS